MNTDIFTFTLDGIDYKFLDIEGSISVPYIWNELIKNFYGINELNLTENDTIIDIGANVGMFSIYAKKKFNCKIISFEPVIQNFENFKKNIVLNGFSENDFYLNQVAITDKEGDEILIGTPKKNSGGSSKFEPGIFTNKCKTETLDKYLINGCDYLKIDCEGGEYDIIPNILNKLKNIKYIGIEYHSYNNSQNALSLHKQLYENFDGKIFSNILDPNASWNI